MWKTVKFGDICKIRSEGIHPAKNPEAFYVGLEHIDSGSSRLARYGLASQVNSSKTKFYNGDVLYGKLRPYLDKAVHVEFNGICSTDILVFNSNEFCLNEFLVYLIHTHKFLEHAKKNTKGVNHPRTSWGDLSKLEVSLPPLSEQVAIAKILQNIQQAKEYRQRELDLERERKATLMQHLFTHGTRGEKTKQTEIGEMPEGWTVLPLGKVAKLQGGFAFKSEHYTTNGIKLFKIANVSFKKVIWEEVSYLPESYIKLYKEFVLNEGDVVMALTRPIVKGGIKASEINLNDCPSLLNQRVGRYIISERILNSFLFQTIFTLHFINEINQKSIGSNQPNISTKQVEDIKIAIPSLEEQKQIADVLNACDNRSNALETEIERLDELFKAMLEELMTGKLSALPLVKEETL